MCVLREGELWRPAVLRVLMMHNTHAHAARCVCTVWGEKEMCVTHTHTLLRELGGAT